MNRRPHFLALSLLALWVPGATAKPSTVTVRPHEVMRTLDDHPLGIDLNYLRDADALRPKGSPPLAEVLAELGARWLRYPGGEKSDAHFFAPPPFDRPAPVTFSGYARYRKEPLDFDAYIALVRRVQGTAYVVVGYDSFARTGKTKAEYLAHAVGWLRYANVTKNYGVRYWEIGNENFHNHTATAEEMAVIAAEFSRAMKAVDPTIKVGTSANGRAWAQTLVDRAGGELDFISYSNYFNSADGAGYAKYQNDPHPNLIGAGRMLADVIARSPHRDRLTVIAAEFGATDFSKQLPMARRWEGNDLGHALALFEMAGQLLCEPRITAAMFWNTRWMDDANPERRCYALGPNNEIMPVGRPLEFWNHAQLRQMVTATASDGTGAFATFDPPSSRLCVALINRGSEARSVTIEVQGVTRVVVTASRHFTGNGPDDRAPGWRPIPLSRVHGSSLEAVALAPYSFTVVDLSVSQN